MSEQTQNDGLQTVNAETKNKSSLRARVITAVCYVLVWFALTALKWCVPGGWGALGFDAAFCAVSVPLYVFIESIPQTRGSGFLAVAVAFTIYTMFLAATSVFDHNRSSVKGTVYSIFCMLYCGVLSAKIGRAHV